MKNIRIILSVVFVSFGIIAAMMPTKKNSYLEKDAKIMLKEMQVEDYTISTDELARRLINNDPSIQLIDLRSEQQFKEYHIAGAINIPFEQLFDEKWLPYIDQEGRNNVFYSNGTTKSMQAWLLSHQKGYTNNYYLKGGLNWWFYSIIDPEKPSNTDDQKAFDLYQQRMGARQHFTGAGTAAKDNSSLDSPVPIIRRKKKAVQGGCS